MSADEQSSHSAIQSVGAQLAAIRQAQNMSVSDVAYRLKLTPRQIAAIEQDDFASLGPLLFSRGFVRNYARLLQLDPQPLLDAMQAAPANPAEPLTIHDEQIALTSSLSRHWLKLSLLALIIVIALPLAVYQWLRADNAPPAALPATHVAAPLIPPAAPKVAPAPAAPPVTPVTPAMSAPQPSPPAAATVTPPDVPARAVDSGQLQLKFAQDAWVRITDASKRQLTSRLYHAGETAQLSGQPPFSAVIGNAANVTMTYNGKPVDLTPRSGTSVAHLTIE
ncbi:MAG TPA: helix-turn-helix domain-containing protein [Sulfuriferula sp.]|nr:helix-turn-helix domain-containing protein [Sulfuriferula sp.]